MNIPAGFPRYARDPEPAPIALTLDAVRALLVDVALAEMDDGLPQPVAPEPEPEPEPERANEQLAAQIAEGAELLAAEEGDEYLAPSYEPVDEDEARDFASTFRWRSQTAKDETIIAKAVLRELSLVPRYFYDKPFDRIYNRCDDEGKTLRGLTSTQILPAIMSAVAPQFRADGQDGPYNLKTLIARALDRLAGLEVIKRVSVRSPMFEGVPCYLPVIYTPAVWQVKLLRLMWADRSPSFAWLRSNFPEVLPNHIRRFLDQLCAAHLVINLHPEGKHEPHSHYVVRAVKYIRHDRQRRRNEGAT